MSAVNFINSEGKNKYDNPAPIVSVIISTYNRASWLPRSIGSVLFQSYNNWELIIWNDGSMDNTQDVLKQFDDDRIRIFQDTNHGKSWVLNQAIQLSRGNFIAILDDDDRWMEDKLIHQMRFLTDHPEIDLLFSDFHNNNLTTGEIGTGFDQNKVGLNKLIVENPKNDLFIITNNLPTGLLESNFILPSSVIFRRQVFEVVGFFDENLRNAEDLEFWWRVYLHGFTFAYTTKILVDRVKPEGSLSSASVLTYQNLIRCYEICRKEAILQNRQDLIGMVSVSIRKVFQGLIKCYAKSGDRKQAFLTFIQSLKYGIDRRSFYYLIGATAGPMLIEKLKNR